MTALRKSVPLIFALTLLGPGADLRAEVRLPGVAGRVVSEKNPLAAAHIYAFQLADLSWRKAMTDGQGNFFFQNLPAGLYKIIAHKSGFMPAMIAIPRETAKAYQSIEMQLSKRQAGQPDGDDYWALRAQVPADVLHQIEIDEAAAHTVQIDGLGSFNTGMRVAIPSSFKGEMEALTGFDQIAAEGGGKMSGAGLGLKGQLGNTRFDLRSHFSQVSPDATYQPRGAAGAGTGQTSIVDFSLARGPNSRVSFQSFNNRMISRGESDRGAPVDLEHYQIIGAWGVGENGRSEIVARYTNENNFHHQTAIDPLGIPTISRTWNVDAGYTNTFSDRSSLQTGLSYREREFGFGAASDRPGSQANQRQALSSVDLFSRGGLRVQPAVLMEYGLYSTLSDGSLSLTPQGGAVFQVSSDWQFEVSAAHRVYKDQTAAPDFLPSFFQQRELCEQGSQSCYQMNLTRKVGTDDSLTFGAVQREVADTLRLYFSDDFFDRAESLYLVRGDKLPELRFGFQHKLSPNVTTKLDSSIASGGGGTFTGSDGMAYENRVRYLVTSLDTQFLGSSTGVFVAFHHLEQQLAPAGGAAGRTSSEMDFERLQLMVNQNLNFLLDLASDWAVQLNMELSRGVDPTTRVASDSIRRRILGGIAVKF
jgi:hypothetical protein